ncbi:MAG: 2-C-methyl-D-erythritol 2,4-cyclodiphosphate synthase [Clostridia bacterium]|nr:2-C-methyl-D-erythritol 2,4-cyclodiphosphate synthase [Clostridia bacterium]
MSIFAVILCGGSGTRMGAPVNKTLLPVDGEKAVVKCLRAFLAETDGCVLVVKEGEQEAFEAAVSEAGLSVYAVVAGGADRQASALCGLKALPQDCDMALIHDGARPFIRREDIRAVIRSVKEKGSGVMAVKARDTIKEADAEGKVIRTLDRDVLYHMQTPQGFYVKDMLLAHENAKARYTDDAALMEAAGFPVHLVQGHYDNQKLTSPEDLPVQNLLPRIGHGYDVHRLCEGRALIIGGVKIPHEMGLLGHSDADVALHALTDALLGAAGLPDIGHLFPDNDPAYKGISSLLLLEKAMERIREKGFEVGNADVTVVAQAPKMAPHLAKMQENTARAMGVSVDRINYKATTTEHLGFEGEKKGISAHAVALLIART